MESTHTPGGPADAPSPAPSVPASPPPAPRAPFTGARPPRPPLSTPQRAARAYDVR